MYKDPALIDARPTVERYVGSTWQKSIDMPPGYKPPNCPRCDGDLDWPHAGWPTAEVVCMPCGNALAAALAAPEDDNALAAALEAPEEDNALAAALAAPEDAATLTYQPLEALPTPWGDAEP